MQKQIVVNSTPNEIRVGILEDHELVEFSIERADARRMVGNVYKGVVTAVRPGLQAAFVDIGLEKAGFLHVSDLVHDTPDDDDEGRRGRGRGRPREGLRPIETMVREGQTLLVQVTKEAISTKGPRLTADISLPGRFLVLMPMGDHVGVSRKIEDRDERMRLKGLLGALRPSEGAYIIRTAGEGISEKLLRSDMDYLKNLWDELKARSGTAQAPALVHEDVGLIVGMVRDIFTDDVDSLHIDNRDDYRRLGDYVKTFAPDLRERIHQYAGDEPIFDKFGIETELKRSLERKVWMKKGGYIVIDEAEALVAVDVNTGRYTGKRNQEETILQTNMLAAREIARQLRLRDIGGIIVIDFIDMENEGDKRKVLNELRTHLKRDRSRTKTFAVSDLGLVEMSRQRVRQSLREMVSDVCPFCQGTSRVFSLDTLANKVERLLVKACSVGRERALQVQASPSVAIHLLTERRVALAGIAERFGAKIDVLDDPRLHRQDVSIWSLSRQQDITVELDGLPASSFDGRRRRDVSETRRAARDSGQLRERGDRGGPPERADRGERRERGDRVGRGDRPDRGDRDSRRGGRRDEVRGDRVRTEGPVAEERGGRGRGRDRDRDRGRDRSRQRERPVDVERDETRLAGGVDPAGVGERVDRPEHVERPDRGDRDRGERGERGGRGRGRGGRGRSREREATEPAATAPRSDEVRGVDRGRDSERRRERDRDRGREGDRGRDFDRDRPFEADRDLDRDRTPGMAAGGTLLDPPSGLGPGAMRDDDGRGLRPRRRRGRRRTHDGTDDRGGRAGVPERVAAPGDAFGAPAAAEADQRDTMPADRFAPALDADDRPPTPLEMDRALGSAGQRDDDAGSSNELRSRRRRRSRRDSGRRSDSGAPQRAANDEAGPLEAMAGSAGASASGPAGNGGVAGPPAFPMYDDDDRQPPHVEHTGPPADDDMGYGIVVVNDQDDDALDARGDRPRRHRRRRRRGGGGGRPGPADPGAPGGGGPGAID